MKSLVIFSALFAIALAKPAEPYVNVHQDTSGNYMVSFDAGEFVKTETGTADGHVEGSYTYIDGDGQKQTVTYVAGEQGFVAKGTNFPVPQGDTEDVRQAREEHLAVHQEVLKYLPITEEFDQSGRPSVMSGSRSNLVPIIKYVEQEIALQH